MELITSVELNHLVFRYLEESGFTHSAFVLEKEAGVTKSPIDGNLIAYGSLINIVQKGLQYLEMEANLSNNDADDEDFSFLQPMDLITKAEHELQQIVRERRIWKGGRDNKRQDREDAANTDGDRKGSKIRKKHDDKVERRRGEKGRKERDGKAGIEGEGKSLIEEVEKSVEERDGRVETERDGESERGGKSGVEKGGESVKGKDGKSGNEKDEKSGKEVGEKDGKGKIKITRQQRDYKIKRQIRQSGNGVGVQAEKPLDVDPMDVFSISDVTILEGHSSEVCACSWSNSGSLLASISGDATARIWTVTDTSSRLHNGSVDVVVLKHVGGKDVTTLDWNEEGTLLATGCFDGQARIWTANGGLKSTLTGHKGAIFCMKWNKDNFLLTGGCDNTAIVWDVNREQPKQLFGYHSGPILDVDWRNSVSFATCSTDHLIYVCKVGESCPTKCFAGHLAEVNCVKWDPTGTLLASGSDDSTAKIWNLEQDTYVHNLADHSKEIHSIRWSPTGRGTNNPNQNLVLASASFDSTVKIWDPERGTLLQSLKGHREAVYSIAFNPTGEYLVSGSLDRSLHIWSLKEGKIVKTYSGKGSVFDVRWNKQGDKIGACFANNTVCVLDFRMM